ncbi:MAG TPA: glycosyltransferase [Bacteroidales bacterium]|jgi:glycosyltransferase involved in cell wall biosynthesis|nr:glycosyltransferase [Bacteroidales bacterium]
MNVLVVCSYNNHQISPFIAEPVELMIRSGISIRYFLIQGKGIRGYIKNRVLLKKEIMEYNPDIVHAHYGFSGLLANLQRKVPVITTFHGSDINLITNRPFSVLTSLLSKSSIFISQKLSRKLIIKGRSAIIPSGVDLDLFFPVDKVESRKQLGLPIHEKLVLFAGSFDNRIKNYPLAKAATDSLNNVRLIEMKGYKRKEVALLMNACDVALLTSIHEGSPQFIKEALACNRPIVSTDVGDVRILMENVEGCFIAKPDSVDIAGKISQAMHFENAPNGRQRIIDLGLELNTIAAKIIDVYHSVLRGSSCQ